MLIKIIDLLVNTPIYPHWLMNKKTSEGNRVILKYLYGSVIEVGAGDGHMKDYILKNFPKVKKYTATDFNYYLETHSEIGNTLNKKDANTNPNSFLEKYIVAFLKYHKKIPLDNDCDACELPYKSESFDCHVSFETLEHVSDPFKYFEEASRVIKKDGSIVLSVPFLFRMHGGEPDHKGDSFRYVNGFFYDVAQKYNLKIVRIFTNTGFGSTTAEMANQWLILKIKESKFLSKVFFLLVSPFYFLINNLIGWAIDTKPDKRFALRWHVVMKKQ